VSTAYSRREGRSSGWPGAASRRPPRGLPPTTRLTRARAASPARQVSGMGGACHPDDLPEGYHTDARGRSLTTSASGRVEGRPRASARSGCARSTGWHWQAGAGTGRRRVCDQFLTRARRHGARSGGTSPHRTTRTGHDDQRQRAPGAAATAGLRDGPAVSSRGSWWCGGGRQGCGIPSTSPRALPHGAVGLRQVDGMPHEPPCGRSKFGANSLRRPVTFRDATARTRSSGITR